MNTVSDVQRETAAGAWLRPKFPKVSGLQKALSKDSNFAVKPIARQTPKVELVLKRSIPLLIIAFLMVVAASRILGIMGENSRMEDAARQSTALMAATTQAIFTGQETLFAQANRAAAEARLSSYLSSDPQPHGSFTLFIDKSGVVFGGSKGASSAYIGRRLASLLPETATLRRFGGVIETY